MTTKYGLCKKIDDERILEILESNPIGGQIQLVYTHRPSYHRAIDDIGKKKKILGAWQDNTLAGFITSVSQERYLNGEPTAVRYLAHLRVDKDHRGKGIVRDGCKMFKDAIREECIMIAAVVKGTPLNRMSRTQPDSAYPTFMPLFDIETRLLAAKNRKKKPSEEARFATEKEKKEIAEFISAQGKKKDFFPSGNLPDGRWVVSRREGRIRGVCIIGDQPTKQIWINDYKMPFAMMRMWFNIKSSITGHNKFPMKGQEIQAVYISRITIDNDDPKILNGILDFAKSNADKPFLIAGFDARDPLIKALRKHHGISYHSTLYQFGWGISPLRIGLAYPEVAQL